MIRPSDSFRKSRAAIAAALTLALLGPPARADSGGQAAVDDPVHVPAGVSDVGGTVVCLRTPEGGIEAIDLAKGRSLWRSAAPARVLLVARGQTFALEERAGRLRVAAYDARKGRLARAYELAALELPEWASLAEPVAARQWTEFQAKAWLAGDTLEIRYDVTRSQVFGFARPGVVDSVQGVARVDLGSGRVELRDGPGPSPPPIAEPAQAPPGVRALAVHARHPDSTIMLGGPPPNVEGALVDGSRRSLFELSRDTRTVIVHRWTVPGRKLLPPIRLEHGHPTDAVWATLDRRHVLLRRSDAQGSYDLYSLETGEPLGTLEGPVDAAVVGRHVCWTARAKDEGIEFRATGIPTGRVLWRRTVRKAEGDPGPPIP